MSGKLTKELEGPTKSKASIRRFEEWLKKVCKKPMLLDKIVADYQYLSGHEPRKIKQYLAAIQSYSGTISLFSNDAEDYCKWIGEEEPQPKLTLGEIIDNKMKESAHLKEKMLAGPCAGGCPPGEVEEDPDCRQCTAFRSLKNKDFLEE